MLATLIFILGFNTGMGPVMFIYTSEILDGPGCSIVGFLNMLFTWIFGSFTNLGKHLKYSLKIYT